ncbi:MAG: twin-arginine translocase subunit TatC [Acidimicrobiales bacterium]
MATRLRLLARRERPSPQSMTLAEHIGELRRRLLVAVLAFAVAATVSFVVYPHILSFLKSPYCHVNPRHCVLYVTGPLDGLSLRIKIAAYGGLFLASPVLLWELWRFITPGLHRKEKRYAIPFIAASMTFFAAGAVLAYFTFPHALSFLAKVGGPSLQQIYDPNRYLGLIVALMTVFGITFEFPVILVSLELAGVLTPARLSAFRRWAIVLITVVAAVITPSGDPFSMLALAVPLYGFYELSILLGKLLKRG